MAERKVDDGWDAIKIGVYVVLGLFIALVWLLNALFRTVDNEHDGPYQT